MTKFMLVMYMCSMVSGECPNHHIPGFTFTSHTECVEYGYRVAHGTFKSLEDVEEFDREYVETNKIVVKFECQELQVPKEPKEKITIPLKKPKVST